MGGRPLPGVLLAPVGFAFILVLAGIFTSRGETASTACGGELDWMAVPPLREGGELKRAYGAIPTRSSHRPCSATGPWCCGEVRPKAAPSSYTSFTAVISTTSRSVEKLLRLLPTLPSGALKIQALCPPSGGSSAWYGLRRQGRRSSPQTRSTASLPLEGDTTYTFRGSVRNGLAIDVPDAFLGWVKRACTDPDSAQIGARVLLFSEVCRGSLE